MPTDHYASPPPTRSEREAAEHLGVTRFWLANQARAGRVPFIQLGRYRRYGEEHLAKIIADHTVNPESLGRSARSRKRKAAA
ncbi:MAG TPA: hypothetical protein VIL68_05870 [Propionibacteriaceae bacterium]